MTTPLKLHDKMMIKYQYGQYFYVERLESLRISKMIKILKKRQELTIHQLSKATKINFHSLINTARLLIGAKELYIPDRKGGYKKVPNPFIITKEMYNPRCNQRGVPKYLRGTIRVKLRPHIDNRA